MPGYCNIPFYLRRPGGCMSGYPNQGGYGAMMNNFWLQNALINQAADAYPYGFITNFTGERPQAAMLDPNIPYPMALSMQQSMSGLDSLATCSLQEAYEIGASLAQRTILQEKFTNLQANVTGLVTQLEELSKTEGLSPEQKNTVLQFLKTAKMIQKTLLDIQANTGATLSAASGQINELSKVFDTLKARSIELAKLISEGGTGTVPGDSGDVTTTPPGEAVPPAQGSSLSELEKEYKETLEPLVAKVLSECDETMTDDERNSVMAKIKELKKAIETQKAAKTEGEGAQTEEEKKAALENIKKLYNEINETVALVIENHQVKQVYNQLGVDNAVEGILDPNNERITDEERNAVVKAKQEYDKAMKEKDNLLAKQVALNNLIKAIQKIDEKTAKEAATICQNIYKYTDGIDFTGEQEPLLEAEVKKINEYNVTDVFEKWHNSEYLKKSGDAGGLMETVFGEFKTNSEKKKELAEHVLAEFEKVAQKRNIDISPEAAVIRSQIKNTAWYSMPWDYKAIYSAFNSIAGKLCPNLVTEVDRQAEQARAEAERQRTAAEEQARKAQQQQQTQQ